MCDMLDCDDHRDVLVDGEDPESLSRHNKVAHDDGKDHVDFDKDENYYNHK